METIKRLAVIILLIGGMGELSLAQSTAEIFGKVIEMSTGQPMEFVDVVLFEATSDKQVNGGITNAGGIFRFTNVPTGKYYLMVAFVGFKTKQTKEIEIYNSKQQVDLKKIVIQVSATLLEDIEVHAEKSTYNLEIDRKVYNVEQDILSQSSSATDILQNVPSVNVEVDGQISLRGTTNITYFINGKPSAMMRSNPAAALQQIPASAIERIEIITNPSAKYKPDGAGGIVNIVLKEDAEEGFNGTLSASVGNLQRYLGNLSLSYNTEAYNLFGSYSFKHASTPQDILDTREEFDENGMKVSEYFGTTREDRKEYSHLANAGISFPIGEKSFGEIAGEFYKGTGTNNSIGNTTLITSDSSVFSTIRNFTENEIEFDLSAAFEHEFDEDHSLAIEIAHGRYDESEDNLFDDIYVNPSEFTNTSHILIEKGGPVSEFAVEYAVPLFEETEIEAGYQGEYLTDNVNNFSEDFIPSEGTWVIDENKTNKFNFRQDVHALFLTVGQGFGDFSVLAGLRAEQALISSNLLTLDTVVNNNYFQLYPTLHLAYQISENQEMQLNYSRRVNRADSDEHNPFPEYENPRLRDVGNPKVKPEQVHSVELGYRLQTNQFTFIPSLYYRYKFDGFTDIRQIVEDTVLETSFTNLATDQSAGLELVFTTNIRERLRLNFSANAFYNQIDAANLGFEGKKANFSWDAKMAANLKITKTTHAQVNTYYRSKRLTPQGEFEPVILMNFGIRQDFFDKKASLTFTISDVFSSLEFESNIDTPELEQNTKFGRNSQVFQVGFIYRFGKSYQKKTKDLEFEDTIEAGKQLPEEEEEEE